MGVNEIKSEVVMIDLHSHLLPCVDDGATGFREAYQMVQKYKQAGFQGAVVTPHYDADRYLVNAAKVDYTLKLLKDMLQETGVDFSLYPGNEIRLSAKTLMELRGGSVHSLAKSRYVLIEFPFTSFPHYAAEMIFRLQMDAYIPILAHCERYRYVQDNPEILKPFLQTGCLIQANISSIEGNRSAETLKWLMERNMVHILATDAHRAEGRSPDVRESLEKLRRLFGNEMIEQCTVTRPQAVVEDRIIRPDR